MDQDLQPSAWTVMKVGGGGGEFGARQWPLSDSSFNLVSSALVLPPLVALSLDHFQSLSCILCPGSCSHWLGSCAYVFIRSFVG